MDISQKISSLCKKIERKHNIRIIFAVESGSFVYGFPSKDSDRDIRFVYYYPFEYPFKHYITYQKQQMTIEQMFNSELQPLKNDSSGLIFDAVGWNIFKYAKLLASSNPMSIEWLKSPILYFGEKPKQLQEYVSNNFKPIALFHHYYNIAKQNYTKHQKKKTISYKKYFYPIMGAFKALFVLEKMSIPPISIQETLTSMKDKLTPEIIAKCNELITIKKNQQEKDAKGRIPLFDEYLTNFLEQYAEIPDKLTPHGYKSDHEKLNKILRSIVLKDFKK